MYGGKNPISKRNSLPPSKGEVLCATPLGNKYTHNRTFGGNPCGTHGGKHNILLLDDERLFAINKSRCAAKL